MSKKSILLKSIFQFLYNQIERVWVQCKAVLMQVFQIVTFVSQLEAEGFQQISCQVGDHRLGKVFSDAAPSSNLEM